MQIIPSGSIEAQITVRGTPFALGSDIFSVDGVSVGPGVMTDLSGTVLDMSRYLGNGEGQGISYIDITIPDSLLTPLGGGSVFDPVQCRTPNDLAVQEFQGNDFNSFTPGWTTPSPIARPARAISILTWSASRNRRPGL